MVQRREVIRAGLSAGALVATPRWLREIVGPLPRPLDSVPSMTDPRVRDLAFRAVDAARTAGAVYADVRLSSTRERDMPRSTEEAWLDVGVRALVDGNWGFAAGALWTPDAVASLAREAVHQARANALGPRGTAELGVARVVQDGHWTMPVGRDPFDVPDGEILDILQSLRMYTAEKTDGQITAFRCEFRRQDKAFASSEGSYCTQRLYQTRGALAVRLMRGDQVGGRTSRIIDGAGRGWEYISQAPLREEIHRLLDEIAADFALPVKPVVVGRYDIAFDSESVASLLDRTLGAASEADRALGYEANAAGTSYLDDPLGMLGRYQAGAPLVTVTGDRSAPGGLASVRWDDEGIEPHRFAIVEDGVLVDLQTNREGGEWLHDAYARLGRPGMTSNGCAVAPRAQDVPLIFPPNLTLAAGKESLDLDGLVAGMKNGLTVEQVPIEVDFQSASAFARGGRVYEVRNGKRTARIRGAELLMRTPEFWRGLLAIGGSASQQPFAEVRRKGEPQQTAWHTVTAVPALAKQVTTVRWGETA